MKRRFGGSIPNKTLKTFIKAWPERDTTTGWLSFFRLEMKTNVILNSRSRELFGITIRQETKTGFLNLSDLQVVYDSTRKKYGWPDKKVNEVLSYTDNRDRIFYILEKQGVIKTSLNVFIERVKNEGITKVLKECQSYATRGARQTKSISCNPYIWVLVAMEMNPKLYGEVITWLTDKLILNRIEAGDMYKGLTKVMFERFTNIDFSSLAKALNHVVFGRHETGIRNLASEQELHELHKLESNLAFSIEAGFINSFEVLMENIREIWRKKQRVISRSIA